MLAGMREVAITRWPCAWALRVRERPKPEEQPVMSQVRGRVRMGEIVVVDMVVEMMVREVDCVKLVW